MTPYIQPNIEAVHTRRTAMKVPIRTSRLVARTTRCAVRARAFSGNRSRHIRPIASVKRRVPPCGRTLTFPLARQDR